MQNKMSITSIVLIIIISVVVFTFGFTDKKSNQALVAYKVYLDGGVIGTVSDDKEFDDFINDKEKSIKDKYGVNKVYLPDGVTVKKVYTYNNSYDTNADVYNKLINKKKFTIKCVKVMINNPKKEDYKEKVIYVLNKDIFDEAVDQMIRAFVGEEEYDNYVNGTQAEIKETGTMIESIGLEEEITYKNDYVSTDNLIFTNSEDLSKYLLYNTTDKQGTYIVKEGDTISDVANANKLNVNEFLIANPSFNSENTLLYAGQEVVVGLVNPVVSVEEVVHSVSDEVHHYSIETQYDEKQLTVYEETIQNGEDGMDRVTKKLQYINGQLMDSRNVSSVEITPSVSKIIVKGSRKARHIADLDYWAWPTERPYTISTYYGYRWGTMHAAIDITGPGHGSNIYAANNGTIVQARMGCSPGYTSCNGGRGNYVIINHNINNLYTIYMHMTYVNVKDGDTVERGTKIGTMGNTGNVYPIPSSYNPTGGTHLHFAVSHGSPATWNYTAFDPLTLY